MLFLLIIENKGEPISFYLFLRIITDTVIYAYGITFIIIIFVVFNTYVRKGGEGDKFIIRIY